MMAKVTDRLGSCFTVFLSPDKKMFSQRDEIADYLLAAGDQLVKTDGYRLVFI